MSTVKFAVYKDQRCAIKRILTAYNKIIIPKKIVKLAVKRNYLKRLFRLLFKTISKYYHNSTFSVIVFHKIESYQYIKTIESNILARF